MIFANHSMYLAILTKLVLNNLLTFSLTFKDTSILDIPFRLFIRFESFDQQSILNHPSLQAQHLYIVLCKINLVLLEQAYHLFLSSMFSSPLTNINHYWELVPRLASTRTFCTSALVSSNFKRAWSKEHGQISLTGFH